MGSPATQRPVTTLLTGTVRAVRGSLPLRRAAEALAADGIGLLVVHNPAGALAGVVSERDVVAAVASDRDLDSERVEDVMADQVVTVDVSDTVATASPALSARAWARSSAAMSARKGPTKCRCPACGGGRGA